MGEICFRGNLVMKGYLKNPQATADAFAGGLVSHGRPGSAAIPMGTSKSETAART